MPADRDASDGTEPGGEGARRRPDDTDLFKQLQAEARRKLDPALPLDAIIGTYERIMPELQKQLRDRLSERLDQQPMNPDMKLLIQRLNEDLVGNVFAHAATVMGTKHLNALRGIAPETDGDADTETRPGEEER